MRQTALRERSAAARSTGLNPKKKALSLFSCFLASLALAISSAVGTRPNCLVNFLTILGLSIFLNKPCFSSFRCASFAASRSWALEWSRRVTSNVLCAPRPSPAGLFCLLSYRGLAVLSSRRSFGRGGGVGLSGDNPFGCWRAAAARRLDFAT